MSYALMMDDRLLFALCLSGLHTAGMLLTWAAFSWMFHRGVAKSGQVEAGRAPPDKLGRQALRDMVVAQLGFPVLMYLLVYPLWLRSGGVMDGPLPPAWQVVLFLLGYILCNDTVFYWSHRLFHTPRLFKRVHHIHHRFRNVRGPVAEYAHPLESVANFLAFFAGPLLFGGHFLVVCAWVFLRMVETVEAHSGYALTNSSSRHAYHHLNAKGGCYGSFFGWWDRLMGTDRRWRAWRDASGRAGPR